jgi:hypothetical protein
MKSPFPGMDPYLERHWPDVHSALIAEARRSLNKTLPAGLVARAEERVAVEASDDSLHRISPDIRVYSPGLQPVNSDSTAVVIDAPFRLEMDLDPTIERYLQIVNEDGQVITVIEFVSPANKRQPGLDEFRKKRAELLRGGVHFVEIDLVRSGDWRALMRPEVCPANAVSIYRATVRTAGAKPAGYLFPIPLSAALPAIPMPLRPGDPKVVLPLSSLLEAVYEDGRYGSTLDYSREVDPSLPGAEAAWARQLLANLQ